LDLTLGPEAKAKTKPNRLLETRQDNSNVEWKDRTVTSSRKTVCGWAYCLWLGLGI